MYENTHMHDFRHFIRANGEQIQGGEHTITITGPLTGKTER